jgi:hypothetical protein
MATLNSSERFFGNTIMLTSPNPGRWYLHHWLRQMGEELFHCAKAKQLTAEWMDKFVPFYSNLSRFCGLLKTQIVQKPNGGWELPSL